MLTSPSSPTFSHSLNSYKSPPSRANTSSPRPRPKKSLPNSPQFRPGSPLSNPQVKIAPPSPPAKAQSADHGTQYTPPDWPPTSTRSSQYPIPQTHLNPTPAAFTTSELETRGRTQETTIQDQKLATEESSGPPEPQVRVTPQTSLHNVPRSVRRSRSSVADTPGGSPANKKAKAQNPNLVVLPSNYAECDPKVLASIIADMLMELIRHNDELPLNNGQLTRFHSRAPPGISVHDYLARLTFHATLSPPILLSMVHYIDRLCALYQAFTINSLTVHRFLIVAATVASKGLSDSFWTNSTYARVGGVSVKELALLELELLERVDWKIVPSPEALVDYYKSLVGRSAQYVIEGESMDEDEFGTDHEADHEAVHYSGRDEGKGSEDESSPSSSQAVETSNSGLSDGEG